MGLPYPGNCNDQEGGKQLDCQTRRDRQIETVIENAGHKDQHKPRQKGDGICMTGVAECQKCGCGKREENGDTPAKRDISIMSLAGVGNINEIPFACQPPKTEAESHGKGKSQKRDPGKTSHVSSEARAKDQTSQIFTH